MAQRITAAQGTTGTHHEIGELQVWGWVSTTTVHVPRKGGKRGRNKNRRDGWGKRPGRRIAVKEQAGVNNATAGLAVDG
jgi:hypothetical protein